MWSILSVFSRRGLRLWTAVAIACCVRNAFAEPPTHWPQFRGPGARGAVEGSTNLPSTWSTTENIAWKVEVPGRGWSSPVVWGNRVFLTTVVNTADTEEPKKGLYFGGDRPKPPTSTHRWLALCYDLETGATLWERELLAGPPRTSIHLKSSYASETPVTDGERLYLLFGGLGIYCLDLDGQPVWDHSLEPKQTRFGWGYAASPVLHGDRLYIVNDNEEQSYLLALDKYTGDVDWRVDRDEKSNWATPFVWENRVRTEIVTPGTGLIRSYDLDGKLLWSLGGMSNITIATPYEYDELLMVTSGYVLDKRKPIFAIRPGAEGDISLVKGQTSNASIAWSQPQAGPYNPSTVAYEGTVYVLYDQGFFAAYDASDGSAVYSKKRIPNGRAFTTSPWAYDGKIFCLNEDGVTFVIKAGSEFEVLHTNTLEQDDMGMASPAIAGDRLVVRTSPRLYCIRSNEDTP